MGFIVFQYQKPNALNMNKGLLIQYNDQRKLENSPYTCGGLKMGQLLSIFHGKRSARQLMFGLIGIKKLLRLMFGLIGRKRKNLLP